MRQILLPTLAAATLAACGHLPVSTMWALRNFDAGNVEPALLRAAIRIPDSLEPQPGGVKLEAGWWRDGREDDKHTAKFVLQETTAPADVAPLAGERRPGTRLIVFRVNPADIPKIHALQAEARAEKLKSPGKTQGTLGIGADACRRGDLPDGPLLMTTFLRTDATRGYLTLLKDVDLRSAVTAEKSIDELAPTCEKFANRAETAKAGQ